MFLIVTGNGKPADCNRVHKRGSLVPAAVSDSTHIIWKNDEVYEVLIVYIHPFILIVAKSCPGMPKKPQFLKQCHYMSATIKCMFIPLKFLIVITIHCLYVVCELEIKDQVFLRNLKNKCTHIQVPKSFTYPSQLFNLILSCILLTAVRTGNLAKFNQVLDQFGDKFQTDGTYTLIIRLRHNVIKTGKRQLIPCHFPYIEAGERERETDIGFLLSLNAGVRMISLSYSRISLADIAQKLQLDSPEDAEFIVAKVRDCTVYTLLPDILSNWVVLESH